MIKWKNINQKILIWSMAWIDEYEGLRRKGERNEPELPERIRQNAYKAKGRKAGEKSAFA